MRRNPELFLRPRQADVDAFIVGAHDYPVPLLLLDQVAVVIDVGHPDENVLPDDLVLRRGHRASLAFGGHSRTLAHARTS